MCEHDVRAPHVQPVCRALARVPALKELHFNSDVKLPAHASIFQLTTVSHLHLCGVCDELLELLPTTPLARGVSYVLFDVALSDRQLSALSALPNLNKLKLRPVETVFMSSALASPLLPRVRKLELQFWNGEIKVIANMRSLRALKLHGPVVDNALLVELDALTQIRHLALLEVRIFADTQLDFSPLSRLRDISRLMITCQWKCASWSCSAGR